MSNLVKFEFRGMSGSGRIDPIINYDIYTITIKDCRLFKDDWSQLTRARQIELPPRDLHAMINEAGKLKITFMDQLTQSLTFSCCYLHACSCTPVMGSTHMYSFELEFKVMVSNSPKLDTTVDVSQALHDYEDRVKALEAKLYWRDDKIRELEQKQESMKKLEISRLVDNERLGDSLKYWRKKATQAANAGSGTIEESERQICDLKDKIKELEQKLHNRSLDVANRDDRIKDLEDELGGTNRLYEDVLKLHDNLHKEVESCRERIKELENSVESQSNARAKYQGLLYQAMHLVDQILGNDVRAGQLTTCETFEEDLKKARQKLYL